jgi:hypothetical protein
MQKLILSVLISLLLLSGCRKPENDILKDLPPATVEGKMTFGCVINGNLVFKAEGDYIAPTGFLSSCNGGSNFSIFRTQDADYFLIRSANCKKNPEYHLDFVLHEDQVLEGEKIILSSSGNNVFQAKTSSSQPGYVDLFTTDDMHTGFIKFSKASDSIYAGVFEVTAAHHDGRTIKLTHGRFDLRMKQ